MKIGIDIMGGDYAPKKTIHGVALALEELKDDIEGNKKPCYYKKTLISTSWHCVEKEVIEANDFLYEYNKNLQLDHWGL